MEGDPHAVLEGLIIGAYAVGAHEGFLYVRAEYPLAIRHLGIAIEQAVKWGCWARASWARISTSTCTSTGSRGVCLRRIHGPVHFHRRPGRRAAAQVCPFGGGRALGPPHRA
jgi:hypothetical protein